MHVCINALCSCSLLSTILIFQTLPSTPTGFFAGGGEKRGCFEARSSSVALVGLEFTQAGLEFVSHSVSDIFFLHTFQHRKMSSDFHKQYFRSCLHQNTLTLLKGLGWKGTPLLIKWEFFFFWILQALQPVLSPSSHVPQENLSLCTIAPNTSAFTHSYPSQIPLLLCFVLFCSFLLLVLY